MVISRSYQEIVHLSSPKETVFHLNGLHIPPSMDCKKSRNRPTQSNHAPTGGLQNTAISFAALQVCPASSLGQCMDSHCRAAKTARK